MSMRRTKTFTWVAATVVGGALVWKVADFLRRKPELERAISGEELERVVKGVEEPEPPRDDRVEVKSLNRVFHTMNWSGKEDPKPVASTDQEEKAKPTIAIAEVLHVLVLQVDTVEPKLSVAYVRFVDPQLQKSQTELEHKLLRVDERLAAPHEYARVDSITVEGVRFVFDDETREAEIVPPVAPPQARAVIVVVDKAVMPEKGESRIWTNPNPQSWNPKTTQQIAANEWQIGSETAQIVDRDYSRILAEDLQYRTARDKTGKVIGLQITKVAPDSIPAQHGVTEGEIVKSINGHAVTSVSEAVSYVKQNASSTNTWVVEFEKQGRTYTRIYRSPPGN